ncbi:DUF4365 domain-containing protein [Bradyrhizobium pachyrhizi]|uniref:DUF4365 domain-containing protein n=1 Tax=Bradyrhizobium pachyrhizi TaxID=280333 RepID=UPI0009E7114D|nr:DUF4365 domain-containing protein [Bradyrhizobium pachyrhizi]
MKKRHKNAKQGRAGVIAVEDACNKLDLIWRNVLEEDVGIDGTVEIALGEFPTGKIVGAQIKSGTSYIRSETDSSFKFYPDKTDLEYWRGLSIPLFLFVHHPTDQSVYWVDVSQHIRDQENGPFEDAYINFSKTNKIDADFEKYLHARFDLTVYSDNQYAELRAELEALVHTNGIGAGQVTISALALFVEGLWGLCSKLQFHSSLLADLIRKAVRDRSGQVSISYTFDRASLYPFFTKYFDLLNRHHLAIVDAADINESLYVKLEYPTFIASLTTNGRRFVEYLRSTRLSGVHDNQFMSLSVRPHVQIEVYSSFALVDGKARLGSYTDVMAIGFNAYLDYYHLRHWRRSAPTEPAVEVASQNIHYYALRQYIADTFDALPKDNLLFRYVDLPLSPLICWLEKWNENPSEMPTSELQGKSAKELAGFADELTAIMAPSGTMTLQEPPDRPFPLRHLANGEILSEAETTV